MSYYRIKGDTAAVAYYRAGQAREDGRIPLVMVGDDHVWWTEPEAIEELDREAFCGICGQIGCQHDGYPRDAA